MTPNIQPASAAPSSECASSYACIYVWLDAYISVCLWIYVCVRTHDANDSKYSKYTARAPSSRLACSYSLYLRLYRYVNIFVYMYIYIHIYIHINIYIYIYVCCE